MNSPVSFRRSVAMRQTVLLLAGFGFYLASQGILCAQSESYYLSQQIVQLIAKGKYEEALPLAKEAVRIDVQTEGMDSQNTATSLSNLGGLYDYLGRYAEAKEQRQKALEIYLRVLGEKHSRTALSYSNLGHVLTNTAEYDQAKQYLIKSRDIFKQLEGPDSENVAVAVNNLGRAYSESGDRAAALENYLESLRILRLKLGYHRFTATSYSNVGTQLMEMGRFVEAKWYLEQAVHIGRRVNGDKHPEVALPLNNLGDLLSAIGDHPAAEAHFQEALQIRRQSLGAEHPRTAETIETLAFLYASSGREAEARKMFEEALAIRRKSQGPEHPDVAGPLTSYGLHLRSLGEFDAAEEHLQQALAIRTKAFAANPRHPLLPHSENNLGYLYLTKGNYDAAQKHLNKADRLFQQTLPETHVDRFPTFRNLSLLAAAKKDWPQAAEWFEKIRRATRYHVTHVLPAINETQQIRFIKNTDEDRLHTALSLGLHSSEFPLAGSKSAGWLANGKAVIQESLAESALAAMETTDPNARQQLTKLQTIRARLATLSQTTPKPDDEARFRQELQKLQGEEQELAIAIRGQIGSQQTTQSWSEMEAIRQAIPADGVLVDIIRMRKYDFGRPATKEAFSEPAYIAWITFPVGGPETRVVELGSAEEIDGAIESFRARVQAYQSSDPDQNPILRSGEAEAEASFRTSLTEISQRVLGPLLPSLAGKKQVLLSPDAELWVVPWTALPLEKDQYALERWTFRLLTASRHLVTQRREPSKNPPRIFANPDYNLSMRDAAQVIAGVFQDKRVTLPPSSNTLASGQLRLRSASKVGPVSLLPGTAAEAALITPNLAAYVQAEPKTYSGEQALEWTFKNLRSPRVLVVSTHGFFLADQAAKRPAGDADAGGEKGRARLVDQQGNPLENPLLRCGLLFAACNARDQLPPNSALDDGVLTGKEILGVDLRGTELVVLSACETGLGKVSNGEGVAGLRQSFQLAGAQSVVSTLWQVPDTDSAIIMNRFFESLASGQAKADALRSAQLKRISDRREKFGAAHPFFWAAWTVTGN